jgi:hypothetical protein
MMPFEGPASDETTAAQQAVIAQLRTLYRGRPFTRAIPFNKALPAVGSVADLWLPTGAMFELVRYVIQSSVGGVDLALCDTRLESPFSFVIPDVASYTPVDLSPGYRGNPISGGKVVLSNPSGAVGTVKGVLYGYEVTQEGFYR